MHHRGDCAIAALACVLQRPYEEVLVTSSQINPLVLVEGLNNDQMIRVAKRFGRTLVERTGTEIDLRTTTGILGAQLCWNENRDVHAVVLAHGLVFDPDGGEVWSVRDYLKRFMARKLDLLELED